MNQVFLTVLAKKTDVLATVKKDGKVVKVVVVDNGRTKRIVDFVPGGIINDKFIVFKVIKGDSNMYYTNTVNKVVKNKIKNKKKKPDKQNLIQNGDNPKKEKRKRKKKKKNDNEDLS